MKATSDENPNPIISIQYCTGYVDKQNQWRPGFNCSGQATERQAAKNSLTTTPLFCCGTSSHKYCCSTKHYMHSGYSGSHNSDVTYGTLLTVVLSTFIFSVMLTIIAFVCCKKFWKSRENLNLEIVDDQLYNRNSNFLTLNAAQLINAYNANGIPIQNDAIRSSTPTSSTNALPQTILSPSITGAHNNSSNNINNSLPAIVSSSLNSYSPCQSMASNLYTSTNSTQPYATINQQPLNAQAMTSSINTTFSGQSIAMSGYSVHHPHQNVHPQALQQALIFYEPPPPYNSNNEINRTFTNESASTTATAITNSLPPPSTATTVANTSNPNSNIDLNTINLLPNSTQASVSYQQPANNNLNLNNDHQTNQQNDPRNDLNTTNIFSQRLLLALGNYRRQDSVYPVLDQPRKKLCRTLSQ